jgi:hypothetical protein
MNMTPNVFQAIVLRTRSLALWMAFSLSICAGMAYSAAGPSVTISAGLATGIAADLFPVTVKLTAGNLFLTNPVALFLENGRVGLQVRVQAYDHRPAQGIAISETGRATVSGILGYDPGTQQILLDDPKIENLEFDQTNSATQGFLQEINAAWSAQVTNPLRAEIPPHPYMLPFRNNIQNLSYDGNNIIVFLSYE